LNGYEAILKGAALEHVLTSPEVAYVEENVFVSAAQYYAAEPVKRAEIEERAAQAQNGAGVDIFSIDTGIYIEHQEFGNPSRASWGATFGDSTNADGNGSGTFTSCIAAGQSFGVAREANVVAVKALDDQGRSTLANIVSAINYVGVQATFSNRPAIATIGIGSVSSNAIDQAVASIISNPGVHVVVGAGSGNNDVNNYSPARVWQAVTVGTVDTQQRKASFSNYGNAIDVWAPGVSITCAWIGSAWTTTTLSGSSASMAYVAGVLAVAISRYGNKKPADLVKDLTQHARGSVQGNPSGTTNLLAQVW
jgi:cerevisin